MITKMEVFSPNPSVPELPVAGFMPSSDPIQIRDIQGLGPVKAEIATTPFATGRGEIFQGGSTTKRNIVVTLGLHPNWVDQSMTSLRQMLYRYFMPELWTKLRFISDDLPVVGIDGVVESFEPNMFSQDPEIQVSIICPKPDFIEVDTTLVYGTVDDGTTEVVIDYVGSVSTGFELRILSSVALPTYLGDLTIVNNSVSGAQSFQAQAVTVDSDMYFMINTVRSTRRIQNVYTDGQAINLLGKMVTQSKWPELSPGENVFTVAGSTPGLDWVMGYFNRFGGI
jgi:hypothetical protein